MKIENKEMMMVEEPIVMYEADNGQSFMEVRLQAETVWLTQKQMGELFDRDYKTISKHINNIFREGELKRNSVVANFATTGNDAKTYQVEYYNLDVVISVGYRIKSQRGTQFRIWASQILKDYLLEGYVLNKKKLEVTQEKLADLTKALHLLENITSQNLINRNNP